MMLDRFFLLDRRSMPWLDGLRALAIILVVARHVYDRPFHRVYGAEIFSADGLWLKLLAAYGWSGVTLFFIISGFLVGGSILLEIHSDTFRWRTFAFKRFFRVYVPAVVFLTAMVLTNRWDIFTPNGLHNYLLIMNYTHDEWLSHYWSLAVEEHFYITLPIVTICLAPVIRRYPLSIVGMALIIFALLFAIFRLTVAQTELVRNPDDYYRLSHWQIDFFTMGIALRIYYEKQKGSKTYQPMAHEFMHGILLFLVLFAIFIVLSLVTYKAGGINVLTNKANVKIDGIIYLLNLLIMGALVLIASTGKAGAVLSSKWLRIVAAISFSTYIVHIYVIENTIFLYQPLLGVEGQTISLLLALAIGLGSSLGAGLLFFIMVERPTLFFRDVIMERFGQRSSKQAIGRTA